MRDASGLPTLVLPRVADPGLTIDGRLDEAAWKRAARTGRFVSADDGSPVTGPLGGEALLFWDEAYLYVAFRITDESLRGGFDKAQVDPHLWERDTAEIMLDPDGDGDNRDYYEIQIGPQNLIFDSLFDTYNLPRGGPNGPFGHEQFDSKTESAVVLHGTLDQMGDRDQGYDIEARIPFARLERATHRPPRCGDRWRANFYAMQDNGGVAFSPLRGEGNFHKASRFGTLVFGC